MKPQLALVAIALSLFSPSVATIGHAELKRTVRVANDVIVPEAEESLPMSNADDLVQDEALSIPSSEEQQVVIVRKAPKPRKRVVIVQEEAEESAPSRRSSMGDNLDNTIDKKLNDARAHIEEKLVDAIEKIQINVGDDQSANNAAPTVVQDQMVQRASVEEKIDASQISEAQASDEDEGKLKGRVAISPLFGITSISSADYNIDSRYTAGVGLEVGISDSFSFSASYTYSQYDVALANANPYNVVYGTTLNNNARKLEYNQNVVDATGRYYVLPKNYRFRFFVGAGLGYSKGYLNYDQNTLNSFSSVPNNGYSYGNTNNANQLTDYEVNSVLGIIEAGGELQLSRTFAVGATFKYNSILSSKESANINNNGFVQNGYNATLPTEKSTVGGSLKDNSFYSLLGSIKVSF